MPTSLDHPAAWTAAELRDLPAWRSPLPATEVPPESIRHQLEQGPGAVFLRDFPLDGHDKDSAAGAFLDWCQEIGTPVSQNEKGDTLFRVEDAAFGRDDPRTRGPNTNRKLSFHTDRCDVIAFLCWKQAKSGGENEIVSSMALYNRIAAERPDLLEALMRPYLYQRHNVDLGNDLPACEQPVFSFREGHFACSFLRVLIDRAHRDPNLPDLDEKQIEALDFLEAVAEREGLAHLFHQARGDVLLLNNWVTLHRRTAFEDHEDPAEKRCLFRVWLSVPDSRPLDPAFEANYGSVEAGAVRGGMRPTAS